MPQFGATYMCLRRKWLYIVSLLVLLGGSLMAAGAWNIWSLVVFRSIMGIGAAGAWAARANEWEKEGMRGGAAVSSWRYH